MSGGVFFRTACTQDLLHFIPRQNLGRFLVQWLCHREIGLMFVRFGCEAGDESGRKCSLQRQCPQRRSRGPRSNDGAHGGNRDEQRDEQELVLHALWHQEHCEGRTAVRRRSRPAAG